MRKTLIGAAVVLAMALTPGASLAAGHSQNGFTVGDCISDGFYGNEPNAGPTQQGPSEAAPGSKGGTVVPSQSPGPTVTNSDGTVRPGASVGDVSQAFGPGFVPQVCRTLAGK